MARISAKKDVKVRKNKTFLLEKILDKKDKTEKTIYYFLLSPNVTTILPHQANRTSVVGIAVMTCSFVRLRGRSYAYAVALSVPRQNRPRSFFLNELVDKLEDNRRACVGTCLRTQSNAYMRVEAMVYCTHPCGFAVPS